MGDAKRRGEKRFEEGRQKRLAEAAERKRKQEEYEASLTPEQRQKRDNARRVLSALMGIAASAGGRR